MGVFTLFSQAATGSSIAADATKYTMGVQFTISQAATLTGVWFYSASGATERPTATCIYRKTGTGTGSQVASTLDTSPTWSGASGSGWIKNTNYTGSVALSPGNTYKAVVFDGNAFGNWYSATSHYWDSGAGSGGITSGIITAQNNAGQWTGAPAVPANNVTATNTIYRDATVYVTSGGGAVTAIKVGGVTTGLQLTSAATSSATVRVPGGQTIALTYASTAPTWVWWKD